MKGGSLEPARSCLAILALAMGSGWMFRMPLPIIDAEAPVAMAMADPLTAA
jgi:hypothetical protein